jgi:hypothetical protein
VADGEHPEPEETVEEMETENDDDIREGASALFGVDLGDASLPIDVDAGSAATVRWTALRTQQMVPHLVSALLLVGRILCRSLTRIR